MLTLGSHTKYLPFFVPLFISVILQATDCSFFPSGGLSVQTRPGGCAVSPEILRHANKR